MFDGVPAGNASTRLKANACLFSDNNDMHDKGHPRLHDDENDDQITAAKSAAHAARARLALRASCARAPRAAKPSAHTRALAQQAVACVRAARVESGRHLRKVRAGQRGDKEGCGTDRAQASAEATYKFPGKHRRAVHSGIVAILAEGLTEKSALKSFSEYRLFRPHTRTL